MVDTSSPPQQPKWKSDDSYDDTGNPKPGRSNPASSGMRRSCDPCGRRKKKCDRELPCRRCQLTGDECTYSKRRWHLPDVQQPQKKQENPQQQPNPYQAHAKQVLSASTSSVVAGHGGIPSFKRCRLSASPATGLVGMQENGFLCDFFGCVGFLPLTTQSHIRETMVKIMLSPASRQRPPFEEGCGVAGQDAPGATGGRFGDALGGTGLPMGPSACIFWCAVALGALVKGSPIESVATYSQRATDALASSHSGPADTEVAQAWTNLAYLHGFMGDTVKFQEYLTMSDTFLAATIEQGSTDKLPVGLAEIIQDREKAATCDSMESVCSREQKPPQLNGGASEHELYRYVMQSFRVFEHAIYSKLLNQSPADHELSAGELDGDQPHRNADPQPQEMSDAMASVWSQDNLVQFRPLEEAADRPSIRAGVGGMLINGCLGFDAAGHGEVQNSLKRFGRCVEVFARYPGLCRFHWMGVHKAHIMLAAIAALDTPGAREAYERLRAAYNSSRLRGSRAAPPFEEWQGMSSFCEDLYCRAMEGLISSGHMSAFSNPRDRVLPNENNCKEVFGRAGQSESGDSTASVVPRQEALSPAPCPPGSSGTGETSGPSRGGHGGTEQRLDSTESDKMPTAVSAAFPVGRDRCHSETELDGENDASIDIDVVHGGNDFLFNVSGMVAAPHEAILMPHESSQGVIGEMEDRDIAAADWLDVTHALLDAVNESGQACC